MICRWNKKRSVLIAIGLGIFSLVASSAVFAQNTTMATGGNISPFEGPGALPIIGGGILIALVVNLLIVFLVDPKDFPRKEFLGVVWPITKKHLWFLVGVIVFQQVLVQIPTLITAAVQNAMELSNEESISSGLNSIISGALSIIVQAGFVALALHLVDGTRARFSDLFSQLSVFWRYVGASILYGLLVGVGLILVVVPGVYWMLKYSLWPYFLVDKNVSVIDSFKMSAQATLGHKWSLFWLYAFLISLNILGIFAFLVGFLITVPLTALTFAYVYRKLTQSGPATAPSHELSPSA